MRRVADPEMKTPCLENLELSKGHCFTPTIGQYVTLHASLAAGDSALLVSAFSVHSTSSSPFCFFFGFFLTLFRVTYGTDSEQDFERVCNLKDFPLWSPYLSCSRCIQYSMEIDTTTFSHADHWLWFIVSQGTNCWEVNPCHNADCGGLLIICVAQHVEGIPHKTYSYFHSFAVLQLGISWKLILVTTRIITEKSRQSLPTVITRGRWNTSRLIPPVFWQCNCLRTSSF